MRASHAEVRLYGPQPRDVSLTGVHPGDGDPGGFWRGQPSRILRVGDIRGPEANLVAHADEDPAGWDAIAQAATEMAAWLRTQQTKHSGDHK